ncbi:uncharacterized protein N7511_001739 [Penicillium nucicola]|uniref:uncharacterized protein n=1 Tax=Penicillium nucicola TaxID=1850975 RepID=UPI002545515D|nr:uncharacterized protein N7511_001739 [Penicillium nucicola]KAJ5776728.1 hypothetical protein N7511_001739 [Penicillium nucicola]
MSSGLSFAELEAAAGAVIVILKTIPEFSKLPNRLWRYIRNYRTTEDVDFLITVQSAPKAVKDKLLALPSSPFQQTAQLFYYKGSNGKLIQIDITPDWQSPYVPSGAIPISTVRSNALPYISELDLLIFKINSCGLRPTPGKKLRDATDASELLEDLSTKGPIVLSVSQKNVILQCLDDVARMSGRDKAWWIAKLALN